MTVGAVAMSPAIPKIQITDMDWPDAQRAIIDGKRITRKAWQDDTACIFLAYGFLKLRKADGTLHDLIVSEADMLADDWVVVREN